MGTPGYVTAVAAKAKAKAEAMPGMTRSVALRDHLLPWRS